MESRISERKITANRENAKKSTGPRTPKGKAISSLNALTHGIFAKHAVAIGPPLLESPLEFLSLLESLRAHFNPVGSLEDAIAQQIAVTIWKSARLARYEAAGVTERLYAAISAASRKTEERGWNNLHLGKELSLPSDGQRVTGEILRRQIDLVNRINSDDAAIEEESDFLIFVCQTELSGGNGEECEDPILVAAKAREHLARLSADERGELEQDFRCRMADQLRSMYETRASGVAEESAIDRSLIPDDAELEKIMRYANFLSKAVERKVELLTKLQCVRRKRVGGRD